MAGPATGRNRRARAFRAALPCLALIALTGTAAHAQTVTPDLFSPTRTSQVTSPDLPLRRTAAEAERSAQQIRSCSDNDNEQARRRRGSGRSRRYGLPAASGAVGFRLRLAQPQAQEAEILSGAGEAEAAGRSRQPAAADRVERAAAAFDPAVGDPPTRRRSRRRWPAPWWASRRASASGSTTIRSARSAITPAASWSSPRSNLRGGYDTNPGRTRPAAGIAGLCDRAGTSRGLRLGAPRAGRRSARLLHRLRQHLPADVDGAVSSAPTRYRPAGFHRPCRRPARCHPRHHD